MTRWSGMVMLLALLGLAAGCAEQDCAERCAEAQNQSCPFVAGDCEQFCGSMRSLADKTGCAEPADGYEDCLNDLLVCGIPERCAGPQQVYEDCVHSYCQLPGGLQPPDQAGPQPPDQDCIVVEQALRPPQSTP